jgi:hypothetical protein
METKSQIYYKKNKDTINKNYKKYYQKSKNRINKKKNEKIKCPCGCYISRTNISRHIITNKHKKKINFLIFCFY